METSDFEKLMQSAPERADAEKIVIETEPPAAAAEENGTMLEDSKAGITMSVGQFGATVTGIYCAVSDFVYKRVKKTDTAPTWTDNDREALNGALVPVLEQYNITVSPLTNLIVTIAVVEAMRYSQKPQISEQ